MIKLKSILNELDAPNESAYGEPITEFTDAWGKFPSTVKKYIKAQAKKSGIDSGWDVQYMDYNIQFTGSPLKEWLESISVWSDGKYFVSRLIAGPSSILYFLFEGEERYLEDALLGVIRTSKTDQNFSAVKLNSFYKLSGEEVHWSNVAKQGKGHGSMLYDAVLDHVGVLFSDNTLFKGSLAMWRHHMAKKAFFGSVIDSGLSSMKYIIPLDAASIDTDWLREYVNRFIVLKDRSLLPKTVRRLEYNTRGLDPIRGLTFVQFDESFVLSKPYAINKDRSGTKTTKGYTVEDYLDNFSSLSDWLKYSRYSSSHHDTDLQDFTNNRVEFQDDVQPNKVKLAIVTCKNVVLLLKNGLGGISIQVLD